MQYQSIMNSIETSLKVFESTLTMEELIISRQNPLVKRARSLSDNRKARREGAHLVEGTLCVEEYLLHAPQLLEVVLWAQGSNPRVQAMASKKGVPVKAVAPGIVAHIASAENLDTCVAVARTPEETLEEFMACLAGRPRTPGASKDGAGCRFSGHCVAARGPGKGRAVSIVKPPVIWLHGISNPTNLGAIVRLARASGMAGILLTGDHVFAYSSHAVRAAKGASAVVPMIEADCPAETAEALSAAGYRILCADMGGLLAPWQTDMKVPVCLAFGSESRGVPSEMRAASTSVVSIPMVDGTESLSVVQAATVLAYEAMRQRAGG